MEPEVAVSLILGSLSILLTIVALIYTTGVKIGSIETKLSILWEIYVKDALSEAVRSHGNPKKMSNTELFSQSFQDTIKKVCHEVKSHSHNDMMICLETNLGTELMQIATEKRLPYRVVIGSALLLVVHKI